MRQHGFVSTRLRMVVLLLLTAAGIPSILPAVEKQEKSSLRWEKLPANFKVVLENTQPLKKGRGQRLPLYVLPISGSLQGVDDQQAEIALRDLDARGIAYSVDWSHGDREKSLAEGIRIALLQTRLGLPVNVNATSCLHSFFNGDPRTAHLDADGKPFFDLSFDPGVKIGCPWTLQPRIPVIREQVEFFLKGYAARNLPIDFIFADWEIDGPIEWNVAWDASKRCHRCREKIAKLEDFRVFQKELRQIRSELQRVAFAEPVTRRFPKALVGNYGVYPDDGYRYWLDYFEKPTLGTPARSDQQARYREWFPEFPLTGYTCAIPVVYTWYSLFDWYETANTDYRWFYNMLLVGSTIAPHNKNKVPLISFVHWHTTAPPEKPDPKVQQFSAEKYRELLRHLLLRGHSTFFLWCTQPELGAEIRLVHEVYAESLSFQEFLSSGEPVLFDVPVQPGTIVSAVRWKDRVLVRRTDFSENRHPIRVTVAGKVLTVPDAPGQWQILELK